MLQTGTSRAINRRALVAFIAVIAGVVAVAAITILSLQRQHLRTEALDELQTEMGLLGDLSTDALLRSDYATVEGLVIRWVDRHDYVTQITATMPNGFVLADVSKATAAKEPLGVTKQVAFDGRPLLTLHVISDFSLSESGISTIIVRISIVLMVMIFILGWLLWWTLQRTAIRPLEAQILAREEKERELLQRTAELESFSYSVSHDLRGPLRAIDGFSHALIEDYGQALDATGLDYIARTRAAAQRMGLLIDDLLALSRMTRREVTVEDIDLSALAREILARLAQSEPSRAVESVVSEGIHARGDRGLLAIVLENLLQNAWKYTARAAKPSIEFGATKQNGETVYFVRDNGAGFDMQYSDKLFGAFQRLHGQEFSGTGIGLATVQRIIHRHGGKIWAEGKIGEGATFSFTLGRSATT